MTLVLVTLATSLVINLAVLAALKIGLRNGEAAGNWGRSCASLRSRHSGILPSTGTQPCR